MTTETVNEFIRQNGAFGVLVLLIGAFVWRGIPYIAKRFEALHEEHGKQIAKLNEENGKQLTEVMATHKAGMDAVVKTLETIQTDLKTMNTRMTDLELAVRRTANRRNDE